MTVVRTRISTGTRVSLLIIFSKLLETSTKTSSSKYKTCTNETSESSRPRSSLLHHRSPVPPSPSPPRTAFSFLIINTHSHTLTHTRTLSVISLFLCSQKNYTTSLCLKSTELRYRSRSRSEFFCDCINNDNEKNTISLSLFYICYSTTKQSELSFKTITL